MVIEDHHTAGVGGGALSTGIGLCVCVCFLLFLAGERRVSQNVKRPLFPAEHGKIRTRSKRPGAISGLGRSFQDGLC